MPPKDAIQPQDPRPIRVMDEANLQRLIKGERLRLGSVDFFIENGTLFNVTNGGADDPSGVLNSIYSTILGVAAMTEADRVRKDERGGIMYGKDKRPLLEPFDSISIAQGDVPNFEYAEVDPAIMQEIRQKTRYIVIMPKDANADVRMGATRATMDLSPKLYGYTHKQKLDIIENGFAYIDGEGQLEILANPEDMPNVLFMTTPEGMDPAVAREHSMKSGGAFIKTLPRPGE